MLHFAHVHIYGNLKLQTLTLYIMKRLANLFLMPAAFVLASCSMDYSSSDDLMYDGAVGGSGPEMDNGQIDGDKYAEYADNPFISTKEQHISTFSIDADGASYANMRRYIQENALPHPSSVRIEEFLNYFTFDYPGPDDDNSVAINAELGQCFWNNEHRILRLGIKGRPLSESEMPAANYVFLIDVSGSMNSADKLELLKAGLSTMVDYMHPTDRVSIITYSGTVQKLLESTLASDAQTIKKAIAQLVASGSTAGGSAISMAYEEALENYIERGNNRVIMGTDGDFNVGVTSTDALVELVETYASQGVYLTVCGFGRGNLNDSMMEKISNSGNGTYEYIGNEDDLTKVFVNERSKFTSVANDSKVQIIFDSTLVESYRLIGYENRLLTTEDFKNDAEDAGEIGAGQTITALYEIVPAAKYVDGGTVAVFDFRYKKALGEDSIPLSLEISESSATESESSEFAFASGVAAFGMLLRNSPYKGNATYELAYDLVGLGLAFDPYGYRAELQSLIADAQRLSLL